MIMRGGWTPGEKPDTWEYVCGDKTHAKIWRRVNAATGAVKYDVALSRVVGYITSQDDLAAAKTAAETLLYNHAQEMKALLS